MPSKTFAVNFETSGFAKASSQMSSVSKDASDAGDSMDDAADSAEGAGKEMDETGGSASAMGSKISTAGKVGAAGLAAIGTAIASAVAGIGTLVSQTAQYARQVDNAAQQSGIGAEKIQEIAFAAEQVSGATFETTRDGLKELALRSKEAAMGTGEAKDAFERLGISQQFLRENGTAAIFKRLREELQGASPQMRIMASEMIFGGEAGEKLVEVLGLTNEEMARLGDRAQETGKVLSSGQVAALERTRSAWNNLTSEIVGLGRQMGAAFAPLVTQDVIPALLAMAQAARDAVVSLSNLSDTVKGTLAVVTGLTAAVSAGLAIMGTWPAIVAGVSAAFGGLATAATAAWAAVTSPITAVVAAVAAVAGVAGLVYDNWNALSGFFGELFNSIGAMAKAFGSGLLARFSLAWSKIEKLFARAINTLISTVNEGLTALGAQDYTIDTEVGVPSEEIAANRKRLQQAQADLTEATNSANSQLKGSFSDGWGAVKESTSEAVGFIKSQLAGLGNVFSLPSIGSGSSPGGGPGGSGGSGGSGSGESPGSNMGGASGLAGMAGTMANVQTRMSKLEKSSKEFSQTISSAFASARGTASRFIGQVAVGRKAFSDLGDVALTMLRNLIQKIIATIVKLKIMVPLMAAAGISTGGGAGGGILGSVLGLAEGGVVTGPTMAVVGEGREDEAVLPLSKLESMLSVPAPQGASPNATATAPTPQPRGGTVQSAGKATLSQGRIELPVEVVDSGQKEGARRSTRTGRR